MEKKENSFIGLIFGICLAGIMPFLVLFLGYNTKLPIFETVRFNQVAIVWLLNYGISIVVESIASRDGKQLALDAIYNSIITVVIYVTKQTVTMEFGVVRNYLTLAIPAILLVVLAATTGAKGTEYVFRTKAKGTAERKFFASVCAVALSAMCTCTILYCAHFTSLPIFPKEEDAIYNWVFLTIYLIIVGLVIELIDSDDVYQVIVNNVFAIILSTGYCVCKQVINKDNPASKNFWLLFIPGAIVGLFAALLGRSVKHALSDAKNKASEKPKS